MSSYKDQGSLYCLLGEKSFANGSSLEFVLSRVDTNTQSGQQYEQFIKFETSKQEMIAQLRQMQPGTQIEVNFNLSGREWNPNDGRPLAYFNSLKVYQLQVIGQQQAPQQQQYQQQPAQQQPANNYQQQPAQQAPQQYAPQQPQYNQNQQGQPAQPAQQYQQQPVATQDDYPNAAAVINNNQQPQNMQQPPQQPQMQQQGQQYQQQPPKQ